MTTAAGTNPDAWQEICLIGIIPEDESEIQWGCMTDDITGLDWGDKDVESKPTVCGGRVIKRTPQADESLTLKIYPIDALVSSEDPLVANGAVQWMHPQTTEDNTQPVVVDNTRNRKKHGIILLWAETLPATAGALPAASKTAYRIQIINAYMTSYKPSYDDKQFMAEVTFKWAPFNKAGSANKREESTNGSEQLAAAITTATSF